MVDKKTNSLKQLNAFINRANEMRKAGVRRNMENEMQRDLDSSIKAVPPATDSDN